MPTLTAADNNGLEISLGVEEIKLTSDGIHKVVLSGLSKDVNDEILPYEVKITSSSPTQTNPPPIAATSCPADTYRLSEIKFPTHPVKDL